MSVAEISTREAWLQARRSGLGGSDAAPAIGLSPYKTPHDLWLEKLGRTEDTEQTERQRMGTRLEDVIADEYMERTGKTLHRVNRILRHPEHSWMIANIDRRIVGEKAGFEAKSVDKDAARSDEWGAPGTDEVPTYYLLQAAHYLAVTSYERFDLAALVGGNTLNIYVIRRDEELISTLIEMESKFWKHVVSETEPPVVSTEEAKRRWPQSVASKIVATPEIVEHCARLRTLKADLKRIEEEIEKADTPIRGFMGENDTLMHGDDVLATWKTSKPSTRFDAKRFAAENPDLCAPYQASFTTRRFLLKGEAS
ncbi:MAG: YqaJ viral recombinase family protein [Vulcanimicrobiaceae bacterium]